jgi:hypothetical protein
VTDDDVDFTSLEQLADYECPECGPLADMGYTEDEASEILGGDENGWLRCVECAYDDDGQPDPSAGAELELTAEASAANLAWLAERLAEL